MPIDKTVPVDWESLLAVLSHRKSVAKYSTGQRIFDQGQPAEAIYFIRNGSVKLSVFDQQCKETILVTMSVGGFFSDRIGSNFRERDFVGVIRISLFFQARIAYKYRTILAYVYG
jgi:CRP-like cAMP-binding protein